jgi:hypothetical protein
MYAGVVPAVLSAAIRAGDCPRRPRGATSPLFSYTVSPWRGAAEREARLIVLAGGPSPAEPCCGVVCSTSLSLAAAAHDLRVQPSGLAAQPSIGPETETAADPTGRAAHRSGHRRHPLPAHPPTATTRADVQPTRPLPPSAPPQPRCSRSGSPRPAVSGLRSSLHRQRRTDRNGVRSPVSHSAAATHTRLSPAGDRAERSPVMSRSRARTGPAASSGILAGSEAARAAGDIRSGFAVARHEPVVLQGGSEAVGGAASPVAATRVARLAGPASRAPRTSPPCRGRRLR